jgi:hypothetical protein
MTINTPYFADLAPQKSSSQQEEEIGEVCIPNISPLERRIRLMFAIRQFIITLFVLGVLMVLGVNHLWRLPLFLVFSASTVSYFQARDKT